MEINRLAVLESGEPAVRVLAAVGNLNRSDAAGLATVVVHAETTRPWYAREADEVLALADRDLGRLTAALTAAGIDMVWPGPWGDVAAADLVAACEAAGLAVVGPDSDTLRRLTEPELLAAAADSAGVAYRSERPGADVRLLEVDVLADAHGTIWTLGLREVTRRLRRPPAAGRVAGALPLRRPRAAHPGGRHGAGRLARLRRRRRPAVLRRRGRRGVLAQLGRPLRAPRARPRRGVHRRQLRRAAAARRGRRARSTPSRRPATAGPSRLRLLALDPDNGYAPSGGRVELLDLPVGTGVRVDASLRVGDVVDAAVDPRARHHDRLGTHPRRGVPADLAAPSSARPSSSSPARPTARRCSPCSPAPSSPRGRSRAAGTPSSRPPGRSSPSPTRWPSSPPRSRPTRPTSRWSRPTFLARRGAAAPSTPRRSAPRSTCEYRGAHHRLRVDRVGPDTYRIHDGSAVAGRRRPARRRSSAASPAAGASTASSRSAQGSTFRIEIDAERPQRHPRRRRRRARRLAGAGLRRSSSSPGQHVAEGDPVAVLESMKMDSTVTAPFAGEVLAVDVVANAQVERGAPLLRLRAEADVLARVRACRGRPGGARPPRRGGAAPATRTPVFRRARRLPARLRPGPGRRPRPSRPTTAASPRSRRTTRRCSPGRTPSSTCSPRSARSTGPGPRPSRATPSARPPATPRSTSSPSCSGSTPTGPGCPTATASACAGRSTRYGVHAPASTPGARVGGAVDVPLVHPRARPWRRRDDRPQPAAGQPAGAPRPGRPRRHGPGSTGSRRPPRAASSRSPTWPATCVPLLRRARHGGRRSPRSATRWPSTSRALRRRPAPHRQADRVDRLVWCPQPLRGMLLRRLARRRRHRRPARPSAAASSRSTRGASTASATCTASTTTRWPGSCSAVANYEHEGMPVHLVVAYPPLRGPAGAARRPVATHLAGVPAEREVVVDLVAWREQAVPADRRDERPGRTLLLRLRLRAARCTGSTSPSPAWAATGPSGHAHPAPHLPRDRRAARSSRTRSTATCTRCSASGWTCGGCPTSTSSGCRRPRTSTCSSGSPSDNPQRPPAVRAGRGPRPGARSATRETGEATYPRLERIGLQALAAMRAALARFPPRERPVANRLVLVGAPDLGHPAAATGTTLAQSFAPLARGAGLEKLVLQVRDPATRRRRPREAASTRSSTSRASAGPCSRCGSATPAPTPVRPLTAYAQKVLTAERFGAPYPYEIVRLLTPGARRRRRSFPPGRFIELDLDDDGETLVPGRPRAGPQQRAPRRRPAHQLHRRWCPRA